MLLASSAADGFNTRNQTNCDLAFDDFTASQTVQTGPVDKPLSVLKGAVRTAKGFKMSLFLFPRG
jgi:hypothetical protein